MRWRRALFEMAGDTLRIIHDEAEGSGHSIWKEEAQLRATDFVQLALMGFFEAMSPHKAVRVRKLDLQSVSKLARCYRFLDETHVSGPLECERILRNTLLGLAAAYRPAVWNLKLQVSACPIVLSLTHRRALILFMSCVVQGILGRASKSGVRGQASRTFSTITPSAASLRIETCAPATDLFFSPEYATATQLAAILAADLVSRQGPAYGTILEMRFQLTHSVLRLSRVPVLKGVWNDS
jgi:hypothetical protein